MVFIVQENSYTSLKLYVDGIHVADIRRIIISIPKFKKLYQLEASSNEPIKTIADTLRSVLALPKKQMLIFDKPISENMTLGNILEKYSTDILPVDFLDHITVYFKNILTQQITPIMVNFDEKINFTAQSLNLQYATFYYKNQIIENLNLSYEQLMIMHGELIDYEPYMRLSVQFGGKISNLEADPTTTIKEIKQGIKEIWKEDVMEVYFQNMRLSDEVELRSLQNGHQNIHLDIVTK